jgi:hypothetical protein
MTKKFIRHNKYNKYKLSKKNTNRNITKKYSRKLIKYTPTYFIDSCFIVNAENKWMFTDRLVYHLRKIGLIEDSLMKQIMNNDIKYLKNKNIAFDTDKCLSQYNIPLNFNKKSLNPTVMIAFTSFLDNRFSNIKSKLYNSLNLSSLTNILLKNELYDNMKAKYPEFTDKHMAVTFMIDDVTKYKFPKHYILRPIYDQINAMFNHFYYMTFISNKSEYDQIINFYNEHKYGNSVIASEYIMNPLLFKGKKCNIRMNYLLSVVNNKLYSFLSEYGRVFTAVDKYNTTELPFTRDVHLSTAVQTRSDLIFPDVFNDDKINLNVKVDTDDIMKQMRECMRMVTLLINKRNIKDLLNLNLQENGYHLCGVEFLVDDAGNVFLLEINKSSGLKFHNLNECKFYTNYLYDWIADCVFYPLFKGTNPTKHVTYVGGS